MTEERQYVDYERNGSIVTIAMNRPEKLNAVSDEVVRQLMTAFRQFDADPEAHVAIFCGRGRAFCSGADVLQRQLRSREEFERLGGPQGHGANSGDLLMQSVNWKPVIAAVHGYVLGLGLRPDRR
jgi:enoyl-CoA hydratase/carnithine racemase